MQQEFTCFNFQLRLEKPLSITNYTRILPNSLLMPAHIVRLLEPGSPRPHLRHHADIWADVLESTWEDDRRISIDDYDA